MYFEEWLLTVKLGFFKWLGWAYNSAPWAGIVLVLVARLIDEMIQTIKVAAILTALHICYLALAIRA
ncbi:hypothetical protein NC652_030031 [Populus alba x Populus x berolinensis]|nr:hypothetical protein NC652_030031 [Populus alba x Populus x berolinensis]